MEDREFLKNYFTGTDAQFDRVHRPSVFSQRVAMAHQHESLARELVKTSTFGNAVAKQFGIQEYRRLQDRDPLKSPATRAAESRLLAEGREPGKQKLTPGNDPEAFPKTALHREKPITPPIPEPLASDTLCAVAGLPQGSTVAACLAAMGKNS